MSRSATPRLPRGLSGWGRVATAVAAATALGWTAHSVVDADAGREEALRIAIARIGSVLYAGDAATARGLAEAGRIGSLPGPVPSFVFERSDAPHLIEFKTRFRLEDLVAGKQTEYEAMLALANWVGTRFAHGTDRAPGGDLVCDPSAVVEAGGRGHAFWCEIAARTMITAATALGWPARLVTASRDAYTWEHAVAELWSNQFDKWFVVDADFNVVFERDGAPLSAWELVHDGPVLQREGRLVVRRFAPVKPGITPQNLVPFFAYAHVDMRTDWCTRTLPRGSPAGGDLSTVWTARAASRPGMTARVEAKSRAEFDWPVNRVHIGDIDSSGLLELGTWTPVFAAFEVRVGDGPWRRLPGHRMSLGPDERLAPIEARVITARGERGPTATRAPTLGR